MRAQERRHHHEPRLADWLTIFPNAACTNDLIDRLVHHSEIISIEGESCRRREAASAEAAFVGAVSATGLFSRAPPSTGAPTTSIKS